MRAIVILVLIAVALALLRLLVNDVSRAVLKAWNRGGEARDGRVDDRTEGKHGRLARDPVSGAYIAEESAVKAEIDGRIYYFESEANRRAFQDRRSTA